MKRKRGMGVQPGILDKIGDGGEACRCMSNAKLVEGFCFVLGAC